MDLARDELMRRAQEAIDGSPPGAYVHFKFTCRACGERCTLDEPNKLYEQGECGCGNVQDITEGGFMLVMAIARA